MAHYPRGWPPIGQIAAVLCIIGVVFAILFPVFQKPHEGNNYHPCRSRMQQLGLAFVQYTQDADEKYPPGVTAAGNGWAGQIYSYIKTTGIYHCPKDTEDGKFISYAENQNLAGQSLDILANPTATVELYEFSTLNCDPSQPEAVSATGFSAPQDSTRHDSQTFALNFLMTNGSVKMVTPERVSGGSNAVSPTGLPHGAVIDTFAVK